MEKVQTMPKAGFGVRKTYEGQKEFDKFYIHRKRKQIIVKTGDGEDDFIIKTKIVETKDNIADLINSQASEVGIEGFMRNLKLQGMSVSDLSASVSETVNDLTGAPNDLAEVAELGKSAQKAFEKLDKKLTNGVDLETFLTNLTEKQLSDYISSIVSKKIEEKPVEKEGD